MKRFYGSFAVTILKIFNLCIVSDLGQALHQKEDNRLLEFKAIDLSDNGHGRDALVHAEHMIISSP